MVDKAGTIQKKNRPQLNVSCSIDKGVPAVFYCSRCKKPYCEDCIGMESARRMLCLHCASVVESMEAAEHAKPGPAPVKNKHLISSVLGVIAFAAIAINVYILSSNHLKSMQSNVHIPPISPQLQAIAKTRSDLEALVAQAVYYRHVMGRAPASLSELKPMLGPKFETRDPISHEYYIIESDAAGHIVARTPTPEAHGVASIMDVPGKPAQIIYLSGRRP